MNRQQADRIIVKSNSRMQMVLDWYFENKSWLDKVEFHAPLESGIRNHRTPGRADRSYV